MNLYNLRLIAITLTFLMSLSSSSWALAPAHQSLTVLNLPNPVDYKGFHKLVMNVWEDTVGIQRQETGEEGGDGSSLVASESRATAIEMTRTQRRGADELQFDLGNEDYSENLQTRLLDILNSDGVQLELSEGQEKKINKQRTRSDNDQEADNQAHLKDLIDVWNELLRENEALRALAAKHNDVFRALPMVAPSVDSSLVNTEGWASWILGFPRRAVSGGLRFLWNNKLASAAVITNIATAYLLYYVWPEDGLPDGQQLQDQLAEIGADSAAALATSQLVQNQFEGFLTLFNNTLTLLAANNVTEALNGEGVLNAAQVNQISSAFPQVRAILDKLTAGAEAQEAAARSAAEAADSELAAGQSAAAAAGSELVAGQSAVNATLSELAAAQSATAAAGSELAAGQSAAAAAGSELAAGQSAAAAAGSELAAGQSAAAAAGSELAAGQSAAAAAGSELAAGQSAANATLSEQASALSAAAAATSEGVTANIANTFAQNITDVAGPIAAVAANVRLAIELGLGLTEDDFAGTGYTNEADIVSQVQAFQEAIEAVLGQSGQKSVQSLQEALTPYLNAQGEGARERIQRKVARNLSDRLDEQQREDTFTGTDIVASGQRQPSANLASETYSGRAIVVPGVVDTQVTFRFLDRNSDGSAKIPNLADLAFLQGEGWQFYVDRQTYEKLGDYQSIVFDQFVVPYEFAKFQALQASNVQAAPQDVREKAELNGQALIAAIKTLTPAQLQELSAAMDALESSGQLDLLEQDLVSYNGHEEEYNFLYADDPSGLAERQFKDVQIQFQSYRNIFNAFLRQVEDLDSGTAIGDLLSSSYAQLVVEIPGQEASMGIDAYVQSNLVKAYS